MKPQAFSRHQKKRTEELFENVVHFEPIHILEHHKSTMVNMRFLRYQQILVLSWR